MVPSLIHKIKIALVSWLVRLILRLVYSPSERALLHQVVEEVAVNERIPAFEPWAKHGREYRRDEASWQVYQRSGISHSRVNFGCELAYWLSREHPPEKPRRHHQQIGFDESE